MAWILVVALLSVTLLGPLATPVAAEFPERPVTALAGFPPGGSTDLILRALGETNAVKKRLAKGYVVVNRPGAAGVIAMTEALQAKPDGHTIVIAPSSVMVGQPQMQSLAYRTPDDYTAIIGLISVYPMLVVKPDSPWKTFAEFLAAARASPGKLRVGTPGTGSLHHMNLTKLERLSGAQFTMIPFAGFGEMGPALLGGHVESIIALPGEVKPHVDAGKMRLLGMFQPTRNSFFPDLATFKEMGYDVAYSTTFCLVTAKAVPPDTVRYLHDTLKAAIEEPSFTAFAKSRALDVDYSGGDRLKAVLWEDYREHTTALGALGLLKK